MTILENPHVHFEYAGCFTQDGRWIHPDRTEITYELIYVTKGVVHLYDEVCGEVHAQPGQVLLLEPEHRHYGTAPSDHVRFYWAHFRLPDAALPFARRVFPHFEQGHLFRELLHLCNRPRTSDYTVNAVLVHILSELCRVSEGTDAFDRRAEEAYEWIRIHASASLRAEDAAAHTGFSKDHLTRILTRNYGCGTKALIGWFVMARARDLLCNTGLYVKEIAAELGFSSDKAFIGYFRYHEGVFPSQFRSRFAKTHMNNR